MRPTNGEIKRDARFGTSHGLRKTEQQREVAIDAFASAAFQPL